MKLHSWLTGVLSFFLLVTLNTSTVAAESNQPADIRILVDISGSMKQTDPNNLRLPAVNLLIEMLPDNSQAGIWTFGRYVNKLVAPARVNKQWRDSAKDKAKTNINSAGLFTNLAGVLHSSSFGVDEFSGFNHSVILLTDGHIDMREPGMPASTDEQERKKLMEEILPKYVAAGAKIHTVALSDDVDKELLQQLSAATNGLYLEAHHSNDLLPVFLKAFDRAVETDQVPLINNQFQIDAGVKEFTALIFNQDGQPNTRLVAPNGKIYLAKNANTDKGVRWYKDRGYELITIENPAPGTWHTEAKEDPSNRIQVLTDLKLKVTGIPATLYSNQEFKMLAVLLNKEEKITQPEILGNSRVTVTVKAPSGKEGSKVISSAEAIPEDGFFDETFSRLDEEGEYSFKVTIKAPTFERQRTFTSTLLKPLTVRQEKLISAEKWLIAIYPNASVDHVLTRIYASVTAPNGKVDMQEIEFNNDTGFWSYYVTEATGPGVYQVKLTGRIVLLGGAVHPFNPDRMQANFPLAMAAQSPSLQDQSSSTQAFDVALDLASEFEQQQAPKAPEEQQVETADEPANEELSDESEVEKSKLWLYISMAIGALVVVGSVIAAVMVAKNKKAKAEESTPVDTPSDTDAPAAEEQKKDIPDDLIQQDIEEDETAETLEIGEFDNFEGEEEVEILGGLDEKTKERNTLDDFDDFDGSPDVNSDADADAGAVTDELADEETDENPDNSQDENLDDDFALDPPKDKSP